MIADPLFAIERAAGLLVASGDRTAAVVAHWLVTTYPSDLVQHLSAEVIPSGGAGRSMLLPRRDELLRSLRVPAGRLVRELQDYRARCWPRDRELAACPYSADDRRATYWRVFCLVDRDIGRRQLERILRHRPPSNVAASGVTDAQSDRERHCQ